MSGKHPANLCPNNKNGHVSCHNCGVPSCSAAAKPGPSDVDADLIAKITAQVVEQLKK